MENYHNNNIKKLFESSIEKEKIIDEYDENILIPQMKESQMPWVRQAINKFFDENLDIICYGSSGQATNHYLFRNKNNVIYCGYITPRVKMNNDDIFIEKDAKLNLELLTGFKINKIFLQSFYRDLYDHSKFIHGPHELY